MTQHKRDRAPTTVAGLGIIIGIIGGGIAITIWASALYTNLLQPEELTTGLTLLALILASTLITHRAIYYLHDAGKLS